MGAQRMIEFETTSDQGLGRVASALAAAFGAVAKAGPEGVRLASWRTQGGRRFMAPIALADADANPFLKLEAARTSYAPTSSSAT